MTTFHLDLSGLVAVNLVIQFYSATSPIGDPITSGWTSPAPDYHILETEVPEGAVAYGVSADNMPEELRPLSAYSTPEAPTAPDLCRVFGWMILPNGAAAANVPVQFQLVSPTPTSADALISERTVTAATNSEGYFDIDLLRNDSIQPAGTAWEVTSEPLMLRNRSIVLTAATFDLRTVA